ncbi:LemA family protein [Salinisphaera sp. LB1]|uniref:LemA family protein n=1 Tax=Salinisphaera sp. LB1 TaxID=2183911 RepID=UPI000D7077D4|nr:LemA family protein [Salinisphaera sp. LB1]AWN17324.1 LemA family protein [Salinisphaera sp. LB1]
MTASSAVFTHSGFKSLRWLVVLVLVGLLAGCGVNTIPRDNQAVKAAWAQVQNEYQRRADLIPNLVSTVKGYAKHERDTLTAVTQARAKATSIQVDASTIDNPDKLKRYLSAQNQLSGALGRLLAVSERYPDLKSNQNFLALQSQLEGTENRIAVARRDYIQAVQKYNTDLVTFPGRIWHWLLYSDMKPHANFKASSPNAAQAPKVSF